MRYDTMRLQEHGRGGDVAAPPHLLLYHRKEGIGDHGGDDVEKEKESEASGYLSWVLDVG